jgi:hypothetical protein
MMIGTLLSTLANLQNLVGIPLQILPTGMGPDSSATMCPVKNKRTKS